MSQCLLDCLKEAQLEQYFSKFASKGVRNCEHLVSLSMPEYPKYGVTLMDHRIRLFKLIQIVKSVQAEGVYCKHDDMGSVIKQKGTQAHGPPNKESLGKTIGKVGNDTKRVPVIASTQGQVPAVVKPDHRISAHGQVQKPSAAQAAVSDVQDKQPKAKRSLFAAPKPEVEFKPGSDSPVFKCRKMLDFSDPSLYSDEEEQSDGDTEADQHVDSDKCTEKEVKANSPDLSVRMASAKSKAVSEPVDITEDDLAVPLSPDTPPQYSMKPGSMKTHSELVKPIVYTAHSVASSQTQSAVPKIVPKKQKSFTQRAVSLSEVPLPHDNKLPMPKLLKSDKFEEVPLPGDNKTNMSQLPNNKFDRPQVTQSISNIKTISGLTPSVDAVVHNAYVHPPSAVSQIVPPRSLQHPDKHIHVNRDPAATAKHAYFPQISPEEKPRMRNKAQLNHAVINYNYGVPSVPTEIYSPSPEESVADRITVCVRKRPLNLRESKRRDKDVVEINEKNHIVINEEKTGMDMCIVSQKHAFMFDNVFGENTSNEEVYSNAVKPLINCVFDRGLATCFAFGQTGAGKTYTLLGNKTTLGLYQLAAADMLGMLQSPQLRELKLRLWVSYYEIYCGHLYDLLNKRKRLTVRENGKQKVCISGLMETQVNNVKSLTEVVQYGCSCRRTGNTGVNPHSSRSHAVLQLEVRDSREYKVGRLSFIDLAGSERASDATNHNRQTRKEGADINQSLLALKECIRSMDQETKHTPYRQSKLTHILRESFTSKSRTVMIANVAPTQSACENTLNTLKYAQRVKDLRRDGSSLRPSRSRTNTPGKSSSNTPKKITPSGALFHPSKIQYSSTPKHTEKETPESHDLSRVLAEAYESPVRGHTVEKASNKPHPSQPDTHQAADAALDVAKLSPIGKNSEKVLSDNQEITWQCQQGIDKHIKSTDSGASGSPVIIPSSQKSTGEEQVVRSSVTRDCIHRRSQSVPRRSSGSQSPKSSYHSPRTTRSPRSSGHSSRRGSHTSIRSEDDIIREHREIMSQLDSVLDKAKTVMRTSDSEFSPGDNSRGDEAVSKPVVVSRAADRKASIQSARQILSQMHSSGHSVPLKALNRLANMDSNHEPAGSTSQDACVDHVITRAPFKVNVKYNEHLPALLKRDQHMPQSGEHLLSSFKQTQASLKKSLITSPESSASDNTHNDLPQVNTIMNASQVGSFYQAGDQTSRQVDMHQTTNGMTVTNTQRDITPQAPVHTSASRVVPILVMKPEAMAKLEKQPVTNLSDNDIDDVMESKPDSKRTFSDVTKQSNYATTAAAAVSEKTWSLERHMSGEPSHSVSGVALPDKGRGPLSRVTPAWDEAIITAVSCSHPHQDNVTADVINRQQETTSMLTSQNETSRSAHKIPFNGKEKSSSQLMGSSDGEVKDDEQPVTVTDSGIGSLPMRDCHRSNDNGVRSSVEEHSDASTLDGVANLPCEKLPASKIAGSSLTHSSLNAVSYSVPESTVTGVNRSREVTIEVRRSNQAPTEPEGSYNRQRFTVHQDTAFTKVHVSGAELDELRKNISMSSSAASSQPNSHNNSASDGFSSKHVPVSKSPPLVITSPVDNSFLPITTFPNTTGQHNPVITRPRVMPAPSEVSPPRERMLTTSSPVPLPVSTPKNSPSTSDQEPSAFSDKTENVNRTLEKQLEKLKEQLDTFEVSPALSPTAVAEISGTECDLVDLPVSREVVEEVEVEKHSSQDDVIEALERAQNILVLSHEEQLAQTTTMCKQEMRLLVDLRDGHKDFDLYLADLQDLVSAKLRSVAILRNQIKEYTNMLME